MSCTHLKSPPCSSKTSNSSSYLVVTSSLQTGLPPYPHHQVAQSNVVLVGGGLEARKQATRQHFFFGSGVIGLIKGKKSPSVLCKGSHLYCIIFSYQI